MTQRIDRSLSSASRFLVSHQSPDGAWRSQMYGPLRDGPSLTPYVLSTLHFLPGESRRAFRKGVSYLRGMIVDGRIDEALSFPAYSAAAASWVMILEDRSAENLAAQRVWLNYLREHQYTAALGWERTDASFGGWGYSVAPPRKPSPGPNISATVYAVGALRAAGVPMNDPVYQDILLFVRRCQNFSDDPNLSDSRFDDGGFFFDPEDAARNKAGPAGTDHAGRRRFYSYGGATADGLRALLHSGLEADHRRVAAARGWLERHFSPAHNPGNFAPDREVLRDATYYYYCWSVAHAFMHLRIREIQTADGPVRWPEALAKELISRQQGDGSWSNVYTDTKEDDPLVATPAAAAALAICRIMLDG